VTQQIEPAPIRKTILVRTRVEDAFRVFTAEFDRWWPRTHTVGSSPLKRAVIEPGVGGRWFGEGEDGTQDQWGDVLVWEPPHRLVLAWRVNAQWKCDPTLLTEVEVRFTPVREGVRVDLEHRNLERLGEGSGPAVTAMAGPGGWGRLLELFKAAAQMNDALN
jgi:uncharacterized protein YndB with AHSA1/START domain